MSQRLLKALRNAASPILTVLGSPGAQLERYLKFLRVRHTSISSYHTPSVRSSSSSSNSRQPSSKRYFNPHAYSFLSPCVNSSVMLDATQASDSSVLCMSPICISYNSSKTSKVAVDFAWQFSYPEKYLNSMETIYTAI